MAAWELSSVERLTVAGGGSVVCKCVSVVFGAEARVLAHVYAHQVPVPRLLAADEYFDGTAGMLLEDLGPALAEPGFADTVQAALAVHACPPLLPVPGLRGLPVVDEAALAGLPQRALVRLGELRCVHRWAGTADIRAGLEHLAVLAATRAGGARIPPFGMCHGEYRPGSVHIGRDGLRVLDWGRAHTGPGLLDLVSWQAGPAPLDLGTIDEQIDAYISGGGPVSARADRGGITAAEWAGGWQRLQAVDWLLELAAVWLCDPVDDPALVEAIRRYVQEAITCLK